MLAVVQRVTEAAVSVESRGYHAAIGPGLLVLLGVEVGDDDDDASWMARKLAQLRVFADGEGRMNRSVREVEAAVLLVSQFTLAGDCTKGNRPSFVTAAPPEEGERLYDLVAASLAEEHHLPIETGLFGEMMEVSLVNDGPVTLIVRSRRHQG